MLPSTIITTGLGLFLGLLLGLFYFGGLWLTVRRLPRSSSPHLLWLGSLALRLTLLLACIVPLARLGLLPVLACLATLLAVREVFKRGLRPLGWGASEQGGGRGT
jgi:F1F0 ATPase subunit 2